MKWFYLVYNSTIGSLILMCDSCAQRSGGKILKKEMHHGYCPVCGA